MSTTRVTGRTLWLTAAFAWWMAVGPVDAGGPPVRYAPVKSDSECQRDFKRRLPATAAPYDESYRCKPDLADVEYRFPLSPADRDRITIADLKTADQEQLDQIYARLTAGAIPNGAYTVRLLPSQALERLQKTITFAKRFLQANGSVPEGLKGVALLLVDGDQSSLKEFTGHILPHKRFDADHRVARTVAAPGTVLPLLRTMAQRMRLRDLDLSDPTLLNDLGKDASQLWFPAKVYCGQSRLDSRRESVIVDYQFGFTLEDEFLPTPLHRLASRIMGVSGLRVRDELRMIRPGLYLGRVYMGRVFVLNIVFESNQPVAPSSAGEACWIGTQQTTVASK
jgi:hypothetical protein